MGIQPDIGSEEASKTVEELVLQLRSSFFLSEFQKVAKTLTQREERIKEKYLKLKTKAEEEKDQLLVKNLKLNEELKKKESEIGALSKLIDEYERKYRVYENRLLGVEKIAKESMGSSLNFEIKDQKDFAAESCRPPLFSEKKDSTEVKLHDVIHIDDDDDDDQGKQGYNTEDDDLEVISSIKRRRAAREIKRARGSKKFKSEHHGGSAQISPGLDKIELDTAEPDSDSETEKIHKLYMMSAAKTKKQKEWKLESDMVKDLEKDDELCLNGVCAIHRQRIIVHGSDISSLSNLACMIIDGDPQNEVKKKASELSHTDLDECRMFAKKYSLQLFNIYLEKKDPFFPTSRSQE